MPGLWTVVVSFAQLIIFFFFFLKGEDDDERYRGKVQWYWRDVDLKSIPAKRRPKLCDDREVMVNYSSTIFNDDIDLGTVAGKCKVQASCGSIENIEFIVHVLSQ